MIEFINCGLDEEAYVSMARDYIKTLSKYDSEIRWDELAVRSWKWRSEFIEEDGVRVGFITTEVCLLMYPPNALYIEEMYIVPSERGRGIGKEAVREFVKGWHGDVFLYILRKNVVAKAFWSAVENDLGWERIKRNDIRNESGCELRVYKIK